jgi:hypothetical protein
MVPLAHHVVNNHILEILKAAETIVKRNAVVPRDGAGCFEIRLIGKGVL